MKDEIEEILNRLKEIKEPEIYITPKTTKKVLDYITNLQNRIKELEAINEEHRKINGELRKTINEAIEYINTIKEDTIDSTRKNFAKMILINYEKLLNILQGKGDE